MTLATVRIAVDLTAWRTLLPGDAVRLDVGRGSHRLLVAHETQDRELARAACIVSTGRIAIAELWQR